MSGALRWEVEGRSWPNRESSTFVSAAGLTWHVQQAGDGPDLVLIHGTGAALHSWRAVLPALAERFRVTAFDLPGHGFTRGRLRGGVDLARVAAAVGELTDALALRPAGLIGHSAGAAIALEAARRRDGAVPVVGFAAALVPFPGLAARVFPALAKVLFVNPFVPSLFARAMRRSGEIDRFLERSTGSRIDAAGVRCYATLLGNAEHCAGALAMMADWDLPGLASQLPAMTNPVLLIHGDRDSAIPLASARQGEALLPNARLEVAPGLGHLAHEERPDLAVAAITRFLAEHARSG